MADDDPTVHSQFREGLLLTLVVDGPAEQNFPYCSPTNYGPQTSARTLN